MPADKFPESKWGLELIHFYKFILRFETCNVRFLDLSRVVRKDKVENDAQGELSRYSL